MAQKYDIWSMNFTEDQRDLIYNRMRMIPKTWSMLPDGPITRTYKDDLLDAGYRGLCIAVLNFDSEKGKNLDSFCISYIKAYMYREIRSLAYKERMTINIDEPLRDSMDGRERTIADILEDPSINVEERGIINYEAGIIADIIYKVCNPKEIAIINKYVNDFMSYEEIGKSFGVTRQYIGSVMQKVRKKVLPVYKKFLKDGKI